MRLHELTRLDELFDTASGIEWEDDTAAKFTVGEQTYFAEFKRDLGGSNWYTFQFLAADNVNSFGNTGALGRSAPRVFGLAVEIIKQFIARKRPAGIDFYGEKRDGRDVLYSRMARVLEKQLPELGYILQTKARGRGMSTEGGIRFDLRRKDTVRESVGEFFHVTPTANVASIMRQGLQPRTGARSAKLNDHGIFLFGSAEDAEDAVMNWLGDEFDEDEPLTLIRVTLPANAHVTREAFEIICHDPIPASNLQIVGEI